MQGDPGLGQQPDEPDPGVLVRDEIVEEVALRALPVQVVRDGALEEAGVVVAEAAGRDEEGDGHRDGEVHREGEGKSLENQLTRLHEQCKNQSLLESLSIKGRSTFSVRVFLLFC